MQIFGNHAKSFAKKSVTGAKKEFALEEKVEAEDVDPFITLS